MNDNTLTQDQYDLYLSIVDEYEKLRPLSDDEKYELIEQIATSSYIDLLCDWALSKVEDKAHYHKYIVITSQTSRLFTKR